MNIKKEWLERYRNRSNYTTTKRQAFFKLASYYLPKDKNAIIVDIGVNRLVSGKLVGDVDFDEISKKASYITPVPGGAGPMTVACLMENTVVAAKRLNNL